MNLKPHQVLFKRLLDIILAIVGVVLSFPVLGLLLIIAAINTCHSDPALRLRGIFSRQIKGSNGKILHFSLLRRKAPKKRSFSMTMSFRKLSFRRRACADL